MSKANAREWQEQQRAEKYARENLERDMERLRYAGCKRDDMPDPDTFAAAGYPEAAKKIRQALSLLEDAYYEVKNVST